MLKSELIEVIEKEKINLESMQIVIGRKTNVPLSLGCYQVDEIWKVYEVGERQSFDVILTGSEEEVFEEMYSLIKGKVKIMQRLEKID